MVAPYLALFLFSLLINSSCQVEVNIKLQLYQGPYFSKGEGDLILFLNSFIDDYGYVRGGERFRVAANKDIRPGNYYDVNNEIWTPLDQLKNVTVVYFRT